MAWFDELPDSLTIQNPDGTTVPLREHEFVKTSPELGHFVNKAFAQHRELGSRIPLRKAETPEAAEAWRKEHLSKIYDAGLMERPPADPKEYEIKRPETLPAGMTWDDANAEKLGKLLHKYGIPKAAVADFLTLHQESLGATQKGFDTDMERAKTALRQEFGDKYDERMEQAKRLIPLVFKSAEEFKFAEESGIGNHPAFLSVLMRLAPLAEQDTSFVRDMNRGGGTGSVTGEQAKATLADIMTNTSNPKHKLFWNNDPTVMKEIDDLYKAAHGSAQVAI